MAQTRSCVRCSEWLQVSQRLSKRYRTGISVLKHFLIFGYLVTPYSAVGAESEIEQLAEQNLTVMMFALVSGIVDHAFSEIDLSVEEIESIREEAAHEYAKCQLLGLDVLPAEVKNEILESLANGEDFKQVSTILARAAGETENLQSIEDNRQWRFANCIVGVNEDLGIVIRQ